MDTSWNIHWMSTRLPESRAVISLQLPGRDLFGFNPKEIVWAYLYLLSISILSEIIGAYCQLAFRHELFQRFFSRQLLNSNTLLC
jgi:hypothetical protein